MGVDVFQAAKQGGRSTGGGARQVKVKGLNELLAKLNALGAYEEITAIAYRGTFGASKDIREAARANYAMKVGTGKGTGPDYIASGALFNGFAIKRIRRGSKYGYTVGVRSGNKRSGDIARKQGQKGDPYYWWFLEFGTRYIEGWHFYSDAFKDAQSSAPQTIIRAGTKAVLDSGNRVLKKFGSGKR